MTEEKSIGAILREAREAKGVTTSKAAAETRIKVQHIEAMEQDDFSGMAAPAYAKGFIKLYAEYLDLDHRPLVEEYTRLHVAEKRSPLAKADFSKDSGEKSHAAMQQLTSILKGIPREKWLQAGAIVAGLVIAFALITGVGRFARSCDERAVKQTKEAAEKHEIAQEPPDPYL